MALPEELNGWPELPEEPPSLRELPDDASYPELARAYANGFHGFADLWRKCVRALQFLYGATIGMRGDVASLAKRLERAGVIRPEGLSFPPSPRSIAPRSANDQRKPLPSFSHLGPEQTEGGGIRITEHAWVAIQKQVGELDAQLDQLELEKRDAIQREKGADELLKKTRDRLLLLIAILTPVAAVAGWILTHFFKL